MNNSIVVKQKSNRVGDNMKKLSRNNRVSAITKILVENPNKVINLNTFTQLLNAAKSTISEDIVMIKKAFSALNMGRVETIAGAAGGVKYVVGVGEDECKSFAQELCQTTDTNGIIQVTQKYD